MTSFDKIIVFWFLFALLGCGKSVGSDNGGGDTDIDPSPDPSSKVFYAGASMKSITPPRDQIVGNRITVQNDYDSLFVKTLVLDDGDTKLLFVILDLLSYDDYLCEVTKRKIYERTNIPIKNIMISATHTHSGLSIRRTGRFAPLTNSVWTDWVLDSYQSLVADQTVASAVEAVDNLEPAQIGWGKTNVSAWVYNRRYKMKNPTQTTPWGEMEDVHSNPPARHPDIIEPVGPIDPEVSFISAKTIDGRPIALFASYCPHYPADIPAPYLSSDYYGFFTKQIKSFLNSDGKAKSFVGAITIGTGGDLNSVDRRVGAPTGSNAPLREQMGFDVARAVYLAYNGVKHKSWVKLDVEQSLLKLDIRKVNDPDAIEYAEMLLDRSAQGLEPLNHRLEVSYATNLLRMLKIWPDQIDILLQAFRIGDLAVAAIPGEVFVETGLAIKEKSPFKGTYTNGMSNGSYSYLATERHHALGGYETWIALASRLEIAAANKIEAEVVSLLNQLKSRE